MVHARRSGVPPPATGLPRRRKHPVLQRHGLALGSVQPCTLPAPRRNKAKPPTPRTVCNSVSTEAAHPVPPGAGCPPSAARSFRLCVRNHGYARCPRAACASARRRLPACCTAARAPRAPPPARLLSLPRPHLVCVHRCIGTVYRARVHLTQVQGDTEQSNRQT